MVSFDLCSVGAVIKSIKLLLKEPARNIHRILVSFKSKCCAGEVKERCKESLCMDTAAVAVFSNSHSVAKVISQGTG